jgi:hypothetical protein
MVDLLVDQILKLKYAAVTIILGSFEYVAQKEFCPSCCSISAAVRAKRADTLPDWLLSFHAGKHMWTFTLSYAENMSRALEGPNLENSTTFLPLKPIFPNRKYGRAFAPDEIDLSLIKSWIERCNSHGATCTAFYTTGLNRPTSLLLIDVDALCLIYSSIEAQYIALSYVWGAAEKFMTKKDNVNCLRRLKAFAQPSIWKSIPQTIKDAIHLTQSLEIRYLWVDSLCIIQDDDLTKQFLLRAMPAIYAGAYLTIVAADGTDANHGLRGLRHQPRNVDRIQLSLPNTALMEYLHRSADARASPWAHRAWTFQEALFSRRLLLFDGLVSWICGISQYYEEIELPPHWPEYDQGKELRSLFIQGIPSQRQLLARNNLPDLHGWADIVTSYQKRHMTYSSDVLNAFAGLQTVLEPSFPGGFLYGLPEFFFDMMLLWQPRCKAPLQKWQKQNFRNSRFPSWSWVGWKGEIDDSLWRKCFNHVKVPAGPIMFDDFVQTVPLVKWYKKNAVDQQLQPVGNAYALFQDCEASAIPQDWLYHPEDDFYTWKQAKDAETRFRYPLLLKKWIEGDNEMTYEPYLYFNTQRTWLRVDQQSRFHSSSCANLKDESGCWVGIVRINIDAFPVMPNSDRQEFIAISLGKAKLLLDTDIPGPTLPPASNFRRTFGGRVLEEWGQIQETHANTTVYEFYNVLWLERDGDVAYRKALGRVMKTAWERQHLEEINLVLG